MKIRFCDNYGKFIDLVVLEIIPVPEDIILVNGVFHTVWRRFFNLDSDEVIIQLSLPNYHPQGSQLPKSLF